MLERGERGSGLTAVSALRLAKALDCTVEYLVEGTESELSPPDDAPDPAGPDVCPVDEGDPRPSHEPPQRAA